jgi:hypothetical protein
VVARLLTRALLLWGAGGLAWCWSEGPQSARGHGVVTDLGDAIQDRAEALRRLSGPEQSRGSSRRCPRSPARRFSPSA